MLLAGLGAVAFSGKAIIVKLAYRYGVDAVTLIMYRMLFAHVRNHPDAEDLTAEVFLRALRPLRVTEQIAQVRGYLRATTRTVSSSPGDRRSFLDSY